MPKKGKHMVLMGHRDGRIYDQDRQFQELRSASDWLQLQKKIPCDIQQYLGHLSIQRFCHLDSVEPREEQREAPEETTLSWGAGRDIREASNLKQTTYTILLLPHLPVLQNHQQSVNDVVACVRDTTSVCCNYNMFIFMCIYSMYCICLSVSNISELVFIIHSQVTASSNSTHTE